MTTARTTVLGKSGRTIGTISTVNGRLRAYSAVAGTGKAVDSERAGVEWISKWGEPCHRHGTPGGLFGCKCETEA